MGKIEKELALDILTERGLSPSKLGLRFDRVVVEVLGELRSFVEVATPGSWCVLATISAPIRLPARTVNDLKSELIALFADGISQADTRVVLHGNTVRLRLVEQSANVPIRLIGFVHNPNPAPERLLDLAQQWLRAQV